MEASAPSIPITAKLWARLHRFDPHCKISLCRTSSLQGSPWERFRRVWVATIRPARAALFAMARQSHPRLSEALRLVVEEAEGKGWAGAAREDGQAQRGGEAAG